MSDENLDLVERTHSGVFIALLGFAVLASAAGLIWGYTLENRLEKSQTALVNAQQQNDKLAESLNETNAKLRVTSETLGQSVGLTQRQLEARASEFLKRQQAETARLEKEQQAAQAEAHEADRRGLERRLLGQDRCGWRKDRRRGDQNRISKRRNPTEEGDWRSGRDQRAGRDQRQGTRDPQAQG